MIRMLVGVLVGLATCASAAEYGSIKPILLEAIDAPDGAARGTIVGPIARKLNMTTGSSGTVVAEVTTLKSFRQEGCKRLKLRLKQQDVPAQGGKLGEFGISYVLNLCRDGSPPSEGIELGKVADVLNQSNVYPGQSPR